MPAILNCMASSSSVFNFICKRFVSTNYNMRTMKSKHWAPKFKRKRAKKVVKIELPLMSDFPIENNRNENMRSNLIRQGIYAGRDYKEGPLSLSASNQIVEEFVPPDGDGVSSSISGKSKDYYKKLKLQASSMINLRKVASILPDFDKEAFPEKAKQIYIKTYQALVKWNIKSLHTLLTERGFMEITEGLRYCTVKWQFIESIEPNQIVSCKKFSVISEANLFAQITIRFHTKQILHVYDRFGRLMFGDAKSPHDILEYVVFENNISSEYGAWRIHGKIVPSWVENPYKLLRTYRNESGDDDE